VRVAPDGDGIGPFRIFCGLWLVVADGRVLAPWEYRAAFLLAAIGRADCYVPSVFNNFTLDGMDSNNAYGQSNQGFDKQIISVPPDSACHGARRLLLSKTLRGTG
jgi:hypothetical protein